MGFDFRRTRGTAPDDDAGGDRRSRVHFPAGALVISTLVVVVLAVGLYVPGTAGKAEPARMAGTALLVASASFAVGAFFGLLFGVPRLRDPADSESSADAGNDGSGAARDRVPRAPARPGFAMNTNFGQVSDWLTKVLVGAGLTQISKFPEAFGALSRAVGEPFGGTPSARVFAGALMIFLTLFGFIAGWLCSVLMLPSELSRAIRERAEESAREQVEQETKGVMDQAVEYQREAVDAVIGLLRAEAVEVSRARQPGDPDAAFTTPIGPWHVEIKYKLNRVSRDDLYGAVARVPRGTRLLLVSNVGFSPAAQAAAAQMDPPVTLLPWRGHEDDPALRAALAAAVGAGG